MTNVANFEIWQKKATEAETRADEWQRMIDGTPGLTKHKLGVWKSRVKDYRRRAKGYRNRIEYWSKGEASDGEN